MTFNEVFESADGLPIGVNLANPKKIIAVFHSDSRDLYFRNRKNFQNIIFHYKFKAIEIFTDLGEF